MMATIGSRLNSSGGHISLLCGLF